VRLPRSAGINEIAACAPLERRLLLGWSAGSREL